MVGIRASFDLCGFISQPMKKAFELIEEKEPIILLTAMG